MVKKKLLMTGGGGAATEAFVRLLAPKYEVFFADADPATKPRYIPDSNWIEIPWASDSNFGNIIVDLCQGMKINLLIPTVDEELLSIARLPKPLGFEVLIPPDYFVARHLDKLASNTFLHNSNIAVPKTFIVGHGRLPFPCVLKPRSGRGSRNVAIVHSEAELRAQITLSRLAQEDFIVQELIQGQEYTVMMSSDRNGHLCAVVPVLVKCKRGITLRASTYNDEAVVRVCKAIHAADPVSGCYNIQLIKTMDGTVKPFEINPRISTTSCLGFAAGVDFIGIFLGLSDAMENLRHGFVDFKDGLGLKRFWHTEIAEDL